MTGQTKTLKMFTNGVDYIIAESVDDARAILCEECYDEKYEEMSKLHKEDVDAFGWKEKNEDDVFTLYEEDPINGGITKTIQEWREKEGRGFFASSEF